MELTYIQKKQALDNALDKYIKDGHRYQEIEAFIDGFMECINTFTIMKKPTAKEILYSHATKNNDGLMSGQVRWIVEAMEEYKNLNT